MGIQANISTHSTWERDMHTRKFKGCPSRSQEAWVFPVTRIASVSQRGDSDKRVTPFGFFLPLPFSISLITHTHTHLLVEFPAYQAVDASIYNRNFGQHRHWHPRHPTCPVVNSAELNCYKVQRHTFLSFHNYYFFSYIYPLISCHVLHSALPSSRLTWFWANRSSSAPGLSFCFAPSRAPAAGSPRWSRPAASSVPPLEKTKQHKHWRSANLIQPNSSEFYLYCTFIL